MTKKIIVDGQEFSSVEEMPPDVRRRYEQAMSALADRDGDGVPDIMQSGLSGMEDEGDGFHKVEVETRNEYVVDGKEYSSLDEVPPEAREMLGRMMRDMPDGAGGDGVQGFEVEIIEGDAPGIRASGTRRIAQRSRMSPSPGAMGGESPSRGRLGWFVALILGLALIWVLMSGCGDPSTSESEQAPSPYSIPGSEVHTITSEAIEFLQVDVIPFVESRYQTQPEQSGFFGDSYGGLFALYALFHAPETFSRYIVGSPSIWWDDRVTLEFEEAYAAGNDDLAAKVFMSVGLLEEDPDVPELVDAAMVTNIRELEALLRSREYPSLEIDTHFFPDETHLSVVTSNFSRGLRTLYPPTQSGG
jgi:hypothetical protein